MSTHRLKVSRSVSHPRARRRRLGDNGSASLAAILVAMRQIGVFVAASMAIFLGLLAPWRTIVSVLVSITAGAAVARRYG